MSGFGFRISGFGFRFSDFGFRIPDFGFLIPDPGFWGETGMKEHVKTSTEKKATPEICGFVCCLGFAVWGLGFEVEEKNAPPEV